jgi:HD-GYP domain-containing protein (c-di-GMP phosphodiesterase class II)
VSHLGTTHPEADPAVERMLVEARNGRSERLPARELRIEALTAAGFVVTAVAMVVALPSDRALDPLLAIGLVSAYAVAARVRFHTGNYWTVPTQLVFVPMLFLLPTAAVPLLVPLGLILSRLPDYRGHRVHPSRMLIMVGDAWYAVGPAVVLALAGAETPAWGDWPIYLGALAAQFAFDFGRAVIRSRVELRTHLSELVKESQPIWLVDTLLSPVGLLVAFAAAPTPWAFVLSLPLIGLFAIFAREREARIEHALTLSHAYRGTAHLLGEILRTSDAYTGAHSRSVVVLSRTVGIAMGLDEAVLRDIEFGALLHDVGKVNVPDEIINKPGALTDEEWDVMRGHTAEGERMLERIGGMLGEVGTVVRSHHEHFDGSGYPDGLAGEEIPIASRVIACCDAFNAMTTDRPYRAAMSTEEAVAELRVNSGSQFDPRVVEALIELVAEASEASAANGAAPRDRELLAALV